MIDVMPVIEASETYPFTPIQLWAVLSDLASWHEWLVLHRQWTSDINEELRKGTTFKAVANVLNIPNAITWTIDSYEPPEHVAIDGVMLATRIRLTLQLEPRDEQTLLSVALRLDSSLFDGPLAEPIIRVLDRDLKVSLDNLRFRIT